MITTGSFPEQALTSVPRLAPGPDEALSKDVSINILRMMLRIRGIEEKIAERYHEGKMRCPTHLSIGQEAVPAVLGQLLRKTDLAISTHRGHAHYIGKGGHLGRMIAEIYGKVTGCCRGKGGSMHLIDLSVGFEGTTAIVGNSIPIGVGLALGEQLKGTDNVVCIFLGDGAIEEGVFFEAANFAVLKNLPVFFVCENNFYSVYSHISARQPKNRKIYQFANAIGLQSAVCDGNNIQQTYVTCQNMIRNLRAGKGPQFGEFITYRWREHCGPNYDNDIGYRSEDEFQAWKRLDPIEVFKNELLGQELISNKQVHEIKANLDIEVAEAFRFAETSEFPHQSEAYLHVFKD